MRTTLYSFVLVLISANFLFSCTYPNNNYTKLLKSMEDGFQNANTMIKNETDKIYKSSKSKLLDPSSAQKMQEWLPKIDSIRSASKLMIDYFEHIKSSLRKKSGLKLDEVNLVNEIISKEKIQELNQKVSDYKFKVASTDSTLINRFPNDIAVKNITEITKTAEEDLLNTKNISVALGLTLLTRFQNNIYIIENGFVENCYNKVGMLDGPGFFDKYGILVGQTSNILKGGTKLTVSAGVGEFSNAAMAKVSFGNQNLQASNDGQTSYTFKVPKKAGHYSLPVTVNFLDKRNKLHEMKVNVKYEVSALQ